MKNGTYSKIFKKWGLQGGAIPASQVKIDGATSCTASQRARLGDERLELTSVERRRAA